MLRRIFVILLVALLVATPAAAHSPVFTAGQTDNGTVVQSHIADPEKSCAVYGRLKAGGSTDVITIDAQAGQKLYIQMLVPVRANLATFRPVASLIGPDAQVIEVPMFDQDKEIYEGFTQMRLWEYALAEGIYPATGRYRLEIKDPEGKAGPYTVAVGTLEIFGLLDTLLFPLVWVRAHVWLWK